MNDTHKKFLELNDKTNSISLSYMYLDAPRTRSTRVSFDLVPSPPNSTDCGNERPPKKLPILEKKKPYEHCLVCCMWIALAALATVGAQMVPQNAHCVVYTDSCGQLLDTLPVCQDFNRQVCNRPACKFIHLSDGNVEVIENRVTVCRDAVKGACMRPQCKYYHIPVALPPAPLMAIASSASP